jgi:hypothetical protein
MRRISVLILLVTFLTLPALQVSAQSACTPDFNVAGSYCSFVPFVKTGENDAIIALVWDRMDARTVGNETDYHVGYVGAYYFYLNNGSLYYIGNVTGGEELRYAFYAGRWYLSDGRSIDPMRPCMKRVLLPPSGVRGLFNSGNCTLRSRDFPVLVDGSVLHVSSENASYTIPLPDNSTFRLSEKVILRAVFLKNGVLIYARPKTVFMPFGWDNLTVIYYNGDSVQFLDFTEALNKPLPGCGGNNAAFLGVVLLGIALLLLIWRRR